MNRIAVREAIPLVPVLDDDTQHLLRRGQMAGRVALRVLDALEQEEQLQACQLHLDNAFDLPARRRGIGGLGETRVHLPRHLGVGGVYACAEGPTCVCKELLVREEGIVDREEEAYLMCWLISADGTPRESSSISSRKKAMAMLARISVA